MTFYMKQHDTAKSMKYALLPTSVDLTGKTVVFNMNDSNGDPVISDRPVEIEVEAGTPTVRVDWQIGDTANFGDFDADFKVVYPNGKSESFPDDSHIRIHITESL